MRFMLLEFLLDSQMYAVLCLTGAACICAAATTSLLAATLSVVRSCFAVVMLYGLCYIGIKVTVSFL